MTEQIWTFIIFILIFLMGVSVGLFMAYGKMIDDKHKQDDIQRENMRNLHGDNTK